MKSEVLSKVRGNRNECDNSKENVSEYADYPNIDRASIAGEKFTEDHLLSAIQEFERITDINIIDFCMYPDRESDPGRYVILMEPENPVPASRHEECQKVLAKELARASTSYAHYVDGGNMGEPKLIFLQSQTFQLQRELKMYKTGLTENQLKTDRVLSTPELIKFFTAMEER